jgi:vitamin B12 transporter
VCLRAFLLRKATPASTPCVPSARLFIAARGVRVELVLFDSSLSGRTVVRALLILSSVLTVGAQAQQTVTVTATRSPQRLIDAVSDITVIDRAMLERSEGRTLVELLSQQAGLQFASNGGLGKSSSLFIRGLEARHTLLLLDGVRIFSATLGTPSLDNLPLEAVERIEIVRGPMTSLYGNSAMGGA